MTSGNFLKLGIVISRKVMIDVASPHYQFLRKIEISKLRWQHICQASLLRFGVWRTQQEGWMCSNKGAYLVRFQLFQVHVLYDTCSFGGPYKYESLHTHTTLVSHLPYGPTFSPIAGYKLYYSSSNYTHDPLGHFAQIQYTSVLPSYMYGRKTAI